MLLAPERTDSQHLLRAYKMAEKLPRHLVHSVFEAVANNALTEELLTRLLGAVFPPQPPEPKFWKFPTGIRPKITLLRTKDNEKAQVPVKTFTVRLPLTVAAAKAATEHKDALYKLLDLEQRIHDAKVVSAGEELQKDLPKKQARVETTAAAVRTAGAALLTQVAKVRTTALALPTVLAAVSEKPDKDVTAAFETVASAKTAAEVGRTWDALQANKALRSVVIDFIAGGSDPVLKGVEAEAVTAGQTRNETFSVSVWTVGSNPNGWDEAQRLLYDLKKHPHILSASLRQGGGQQGKKGGGQQASAADDPFGSVEEVGAVRHLNRQQGARVLPDWESLKVLFLRTKPKAETLVKEDTAGYAPETLRMESVNFLFEMDFLTKTLAVVGAAVGLNVVGVAGAAVGALLFPLARVLAQKMGEWSADAGTRGAGTQVRKAETLSWKINAPMPGKVDAYTDTSLAASRKAVIDAMTKKVGSEMRLGIWRIGAGVRADFNTIQSILANSKHTLHLAVNPAQGDWNVLKVAWPEFGGAPAFRKFWDTEIAPRLSKHAQVVFETVTETDRSNLAVANPQFATLQPGGMRPKQCKGCSAFGYAMDTDDVATDFLCPDCAPDDVGAVVAAEDFRNLAYRMMERQRSGRVLPHAVTAVLKDSCRALTNAPNPEAAGRGLHVLMNWMRS